MKITFEDNSYIEVVKSNAPNKVFVTVAAKSIENSKKLIINCVELTTEQLLALFKSSS